MTLPRLAVLISGRGRNLEALCAAIHRGELAAQIVLVISSRADAPGLAVAQRHHIPTAIIEPSHHPNRAAMDTALMQTLDAAQPDLIALAGYMRILTPDFVLRYLGRLFNIHPSLLPKYPGLNTHARALTQGDARHGASVHFVTPELDGGPVVLQGSVAIQTGDTPDTLSERVMYQVERHIYAPVLHWAATGRLRFTDQQQVQLDGTPLHAPLQLYGYMT